MDGRSKSRRGRPRAGADDVHERDAPDGLTESQRLVLQTIRDAIARHGYPPTYREIAVAAGFASPSSVGHQLRALQRKGFLRRDGNLPRAMELLTPELSGSTSA
jgi:repressor LexA